MQESGSTRGLQSSLALVLTASLVSAPLDSQQAGRPMPSVMSRPVPEAVAILNDAGFRSIEVARVLRDDMPAEIVIMQFPPPSPPPGVAVLRGGGQTLYPVSTPIWLVVVEPLPVLPDLAGWRADRAMAHLTALHRDIIPILDNPQADPGRRIVTAQSLPPGPVLPPTRILLSTAPVRTDTVIREIQVPVLRVDTVTVTRVDTITVPQVDTVTIPQVDTVTASRVDTVAATDTILVSNGTGLSIAWAIVGGAILTLAGLGLGFLGCRMAGPAGVPPTFPARRGPPRKPAREESPEKPKGPDLPEFSPVIVDEAVWSSGGQASEGYGLVSASVADLVLGRVKGGIDAAAPELGGAAVIGAAEALLRARLGRAFPGRGADYVRKLSEALSTPLPRVLVTAWRTYEEFLPFTATNRPASSGEVNLIEQQTEARWEIAPRFEGDELSHPRLLVALTLRLEAGIVEVSEGRFSALRAASVGYEGTLRFKDAPKELATFGPKELELPGRRIDLGDGWPIRPDLD